MATASAQIPEQTRIAQINDRVRKPEGVISRRAQQYLIMGIAVVIVLVAMFSSNRQRKAVSPVASSLTPAIHDGNERKLADYSAGLAQQQNLGERRQALPQLPPPSNPTALAGYRQAGGSPSQQPGYYASGAPDGTTAERDPLLDKERERSYNSRFASNIAYVAPPSPPSSIPEPRPMNVNTDSQISSNLQQPPQTAATKKPATVNVNGATGQPFALFEGSIIETTLLTRLDGDFSGPVKVMVTNPVYSHDRQHVLIPDGSNILGEVKPVQGLGQRRLAVVFHRLIMPDGYSVDLDQFHGLNQVGETGLKDQVNNHYVQIFGASIALGIIAGAAEATTPNVGINASGADAYRTGVASSVSQSSTRVLDKFMNINPTLTIREGHRIKIYLTNDLLLPAYENHTVPPNI
jgi:type IV secretory pathway VirB10-like protein